MVIKMSNLNVDFTAILAGTHRYVIIANLKKNSKDKTDPRYIKVCKLKSPMPYICYISIDFNNSKYCYLCTIQYTVLRP